MNSNLTTDSLALIEPDMNAIALCLLIAYQRGLMLDELEKAGATKSDDVSSCEMKTLQSAAWQIGSVLARHHRSPTITPITSEN